MGAAFGSTFIRVAFADMFVSAIASKQYVPFNEESSRWGTDRKSLEGH